MPGSLVIQLHVIGFTSDHGGLILAGRKGAQNGSYVLRIDDDLLGHLATARNGGPVLKMAALNQPSSEPSEAPGQAAQPGEAGSAEPARPLRTPVRSGLSPREIQARLRAGRTIEEVAAEAGVSTDWVERFAAPVLAEQAAAVARATQSVFHTPRRGSSSRPLEASVLRNLADRGVSLTAREFAEGWSAFHLFEHDWLVRFQFRSRGRPMLAEWTLHMSTGTLGARNRLGTELGYVDPGRPATVLADIETPVEMPPSRRATDRAGVATRRTATRKPPGSGAAPGNTLRKAGAPTRAGAPKARVLKAAAPTGTTAAKKAGTAKKATPPASARRVASSKTGGPAARSGASHQEAGNGRSLGRRSPDLGPVPLPGAHGDPPAGGFDPLGNGARPAARTGIPERAAGGPPPPDHRDRTGERTAQGDRPGRRA